MSKYEACETNITDTKHLISALKAMGHNPEYSAEGLEMRGYHGDKKTAHIVLRKAGVFGDVGFVKYDGKYTLVRDDYDRNRNFGDNFLSSLSKTYKECQTMAVAKSKGYVFIGKKTLDSGEVQLQFEAPLFR
jgi:hypothetical protein